MGFSGKTEYLGLPQYLGEDKPAWLTDFNAAMESIDNGVQENSVLSKQAASDADKALNSVAFTEIPFVPDTTMYGFDAFMSNCVLCLNIDFFDFNLGDWSLVNDVWVYKLLHFEENPFNLTQGKSYQFPMPVLANFETEWNSTMSVSVEYTGIVTQFTFRSNKKIPIGGIFHCSWLYTFTSN